MQVERRIIESNLPSKGFIQENTAHHRYFYHEYQGRRTGAYTYTSYGSKIKTYRENLLHMMKKQLRLDTVRQVIDLFKCPITGDDYNKILIDKGMILIN